MATEAAKVQPKAVTIGSDGNENHRFDDVRIFAVLLCRQRRICNLSGNWSAGARARVVSVLAQASAQSQLATMNASVALYGRGAARGQQCRPTAKGPGEEKGGRLCRKVPGDGAGARSLANGGVSVHKGAWGEAAFNTKAQLHSSTRNQYPRQYNQYIGP